MGITNEDRLLDSIGQLFEQNRELLTKVTRIETNQSNQQKQIDSIQKELKEIQGDRRKVFAMWWVMTPLAAGATAYLFRHFSG